MRIVFTLICFLMAGIATAQDADRDITGTWEGDLVRNGGALEGIQRTYKMKWELVQVEKEVYGIIYFYPQDTKEGDKPNAWYTWYGRQSKLNGFPFQFIQGRYIEGLGSTQVYQFNVKLDQSDSAETLSGNWYLQLESLNSRERPAGVYSVRRVSYRVSDNLWLKRKEKEILEKLDKQKGAE